MSDQIAVARLQVARDRPYFAAVLWTLQPVPVKDFAKMMPGPIGVDQYLRLYYDPERVGAWSIDALSTVLIHEIGHVLRAHATRCGERDKLVWNISSDEEINDDLAQEKLKFPDDTPGVFPSTFKHPDGLMSEEYYDLLMKNAKVVTVSVKGAGHGSCGSVAHGHAEGHEAPSEGTGDVPPGISHAESELIRQRVAEDVVAHAKSRGTVPAWLERWAKEKLKAKVDWRRMLAALIRRACGDAQGAVDFTYQRPSRRSAAVPGIILPALRQPTPRVAVVVDTSGSMSDKELAQALAEIAGVLEAGGQRDGVTVLAVDAAVAATSKVFRPDQIRLAGGGGTDMGVGIAAAAKLRPRPHVIIVATDGETPWPPAPRIPVIIARTQPKSSYAVPTWATLVDITPEGS